MPDVGNTPQFEAPTLADLCRLINERPLWMLQDRVPLAVDPETYERASIEMREVQARQGRTVLAAAWVEQPNFLLRGVPVVIHD